MTNGKESNREFAISGDFKFLNRPQLTQCENSWNSCQDLAISYIFPFALATLDKILFILASRKPFEFFDSILGKSLIKSVKRMNKL